MPKIRFFISFRSLFIPTDHFNTRLVDGFFIILAKKMKRLILLSAVAALASCGGTKEEKTVATPSKQWVCDSVEKVTIDSITGAQLFEKVAKCDSVEVTP